MNDGQLIKPKRGRRSKKDILAAAEAALTQVDAESLASKNENNIEDSNIKIEIEEAQASAVAVATQASAVAQVVEIEESVSVEIEESENEKLEETTKNISDENVILNETDICGPCTKLIGSIDIIPDNTIVIILDDDIVMRDNFIESMYKSYLVNPTKVSTHFIHDQAKFREVAGFGGYVFNINELKDIKPFYYTMPESCVKIDDTWISWCIKKLGVEVVKAIDNDPWNNVLDIPNTDPNPDWYELCKHSSRDQLLAKALPLLLID